MIRKIFFLSLCSVFAGQLFSKEWPVLRTYDSEHTYRIAMPLGGIGTGTVSLGGRGQLQDWEIMNRPAKGYNPGSGRNNSAFFVIHTDIGGKSDTRLLEGPVPFYLYEGASGAVATNHGLPRFSNVSFATAYPFGEVSLTTPQLPLQVRIKAFNPLIPADPEKSGIPMAVMDFEVTSTGELPVRFSICATMQNFIGEDGTAGKAKDNRNIFREGSGFSGIFFTSDGVDNNADQYGDMSLVTTSQGRVTYRTAWMPERWGTSILDFWDDFSLDGILENRVDNASEKPMASLSASGELSPHGTSTVRFILTWYFPNRTAWSSAPLKNYYSTKYSDSWDVAARSIAELPALEEKTLEFVNAFCESNLPLPVKEAALFNLSTLRSQTCFRLQDGNLYAWEGCNDNSGCCFGSCTHVWNYETATAFLFGDLARSMRKVEFDLATTDKGLMSFRVKLPLTMVNDFAKVAADGQMGCIMKLYREWQLSGDDGFLKSLYPKAKTALSYAWIPGGWDGDQDGVMEGVQHNTMDVEYYGPNPQMTIWYLGALRAMEEMAIYMKDKEMAARCRKLFLSGSAWTDANLFNGEYYVHRLMVPKKETIPQEQLVGMGATDYGNPDYQLLEGCLVDQLVGQYMAHVCGLGYLVKPENAARALQSIMKYNFRPDLNDHFNCFRSYALGDEAALLMAAYPGERPANPFPYFTEVMTGFEYTAAAGMLFEGMNEYGLKCIENIRERYDGRKRSPFDEAECGHHYGRAMASWSALLALTGFCYSGVTGELKLADVGGRQFWSDGYAYGTFELLKGKSGASVRIEVLGGEISLKKITVENTGTITLKEKQKYAPGKPAEFSYFRQ